MKDVPVSHDPHFLNWPRQPSHPQNVNNNCFSYAVGNKVTIEQYADRDHPAIRQPEPGDAIGLPTKIYSLAHGFKASTICTLAAKMKMMPIKVADHDGLPEAPQGKRLVVMWFLPAAKAANAMYHWARQDPVDPANPKAPRVFTGKMADEVPSSRDSRGHVITDPRYAHFRAGQEGPFFFFVPEEGLDLAMHKDWVRPVIDAYDSQKDMKHGRPVSELGAAFSSMATLARHSNDPKFEQFIHAVALRNGVRVLPR